MTRLERRCSCYALSIRAFAAVTLFLGSQCASLSQGLSYNWNNYGHDGQHSAISANAAQPLSAVHWSSPVDLIPPYNGSGDLLIHYGSPLLTKNGTLILPVKINLSSDFKFEGRNAVTG